VHGRRKDSELTITSALSKHKSPKHRISIIEFSTTVTVLQPSEGMTSKRKSCPPKRECTEASRQSKKAEWYQRNPQTPSLIEQSNISSNLRSFTKLQPFKSQDLHSSPTKDVLPKILAAKK